MTGVIVIVKFVGGYGFIAPHGGGDCYRDRHFFHATDCGAGVFSGLHVGQVVEFESTRNEQGLRATHVRPAEPTAH